MHVAAHVVGQRAQIGRWSNRSRGNVHPTRQSKVPKGALRAANCVPRGKVGCAARGKVHQARQAAVPPMAIAKQTSSVLMVTARRAAPAGDKSRVVLA
jgi:hypothetical protein